MRRLGSGEALFVLSARGTGRISRERSRVTVRDPARLAALARGGEDAWGGEGEGLWTSVNTGAGEGKALAAKTLMARLVPDIEKSVGESR